MKRGWNKRVMGIYEESRLNDSGLDRVPGLDVEINRHGLQSISYWLGKYALYLVQKFYAAYYAIIV